MNGTRPSKRARDDTGESSSHTPGTPVSFERDGKFWLDDGNLVLVARNVGFRVYRGLLAAQSEVFRNMFSAGDSAVGNTFDGCPVVQLSDSPEYVRYLLDVILPTSTRRFYQDEKGPYISFEQVAAVIGLAHKYNIADLERQALSVLKSCYCHTFEAFEYDSRPITVEKVDAIAAIALARLTDTPTILPLALYRCCALRSSVLDGWMGEDGKIEHLSPEDLRRCIDGRDALAREATSILFKVFHPIPADRCLTPSSCRKRSPKLLAEAGADPGATDPDVLGSWRGFIKAGVLEHGLCMECEKLLVERDKTVRREVWGRLPQLFGLQIEGWGTS
ncbi:hypothetical protein VTO73DRAFT_11936 [Trametes versicolor]